MGFKLKPRHVRKACKFAYKAAPIALKVAEIACPGVKPISIAAKAVKLLF